MFRKLAAVFLASAALLLGGCGYNTLQSQDEGIKASWSEVLNQYQRRADLVPNLVNTVKGYAAQEEKVLTEVTRARASVAGIKATPELINDPEAFAKFQAAQSQLGGALSRLLVVPCPMMPTAMGLARLCHSRRCQTTWSDPLARSQFVAILKQSISSGILSFDVDGSGVATGVPISLLGTATHPAITAADFLVI